VNYQYLIGLADAETMKGSGAKWYENPPTAAPYIVSKAKMKIMVVDLNRMNATPDNGWDFFFGGGQQVRWFYSNHAVRNRFDPNRSELRRFVKGSNRLYSDGHVLWAQADELGREDKAITAAIDSARYSHSGNDRPYWW
jgi:hypothetical protein